MNLRIDENLCIKLGLMNTIFEISKKEKNINER